MAIKKTKAGTFVMDFRDQHKRRIRKTFDTHKEARDYEKSVLAQVASRDYVKPSEKTVREAAEAWYNRKAGVVEGDGKQSDARSNYRRSSLVDWSNHVKHYIEPSLGAVKCYDLDVEAVEAALQEWNKRVSAKMVNKVLTTLSSVLDLAKRYKWCKANVAKEAERLKIATEDEGDEVTPDMVYDHSEIRRLIEATEPGTVKRLMVMVPALTVCV